MLITQQFMALEYSLNSDLYLLSAWFNNNYLKVNTAKTQAMLVGNASYEYSFKMEDSKVDITDTMKILGVVLNQRLTFKHHITEQVKKACAKALALRRLHKFIPQDIMVQLYKAYILEHC